MTSGCSIVHVSKAVQLLPVTVPGVVMNQGRLIANKTAPPDPARATQGQNKLPEGPLGFNAFF